MTSKSSSCASPATGQPVMFRTVSPHAPDGRQPDLVQAAEDLRQGLELEVVELDRLPRRELARALPVLEGELADGPELRRRRPPGGQLDPEHERPDLRLVVVEAPPLESDEILLGHLLVACGDQRGELAEHSERVLLALDPLDGVALENELERGWALLGRSAGCHLTHSRSSTTFRSAPETTKTPGSRRPLLLTVGEDYAFPSSARRSGGPASAGWST